MFFTYQEHKTKKNSEFSWGIEPQTLGFRTPMLYHWTTEIWWWGRPITKLINDMPCILLWLAMLMALQTNIYTTHLLKLHISFSAHSLMIFLGFCLLKRSLKRWSSLMYRSLVLNSFKVVLNTLTAHSSGIGSSSLLFISKHKNTFNQGHLSSSNKKTRIII